MYVCICFVFCSSFNSLACVSCCLVISKITLAHLPIFLPHEMDADLAQSFLFAAISWWHSSRRQGSLCVRLQRKNWWNIRKGKSFWDPGRAQLHPHGAGSRAERAWSSCSRLIMTWNNCGSLTPRRSFSHDHPLFLFAWLAHYVAHSLIYVICRKIPRPSENRWFLVD